MHIEPGMVEAGKIGLSYLTAGGAITLSAKLLLEHIKENSFFSLLIKSLLAIVSVFIFFEVFPHHPIGVSEVHLIMGSTLFLLFGAAPAAIGLMLGLLIQGLFFAPFDLPQYGMNLSTLVFPLFAMSYIAKRVIKPDTAYKDLSYKQALTLSTTYQAGIVGWVTFWAFYGQGFGAENLASVASFGAAYMSIIIIEPLVDLSVLAVVKYFSKFENSLFISNRVFLVDQRV
ncbi:MAG: energy-coupling factor ABC transporter permease [Pseudomonadota bacterium]